eukprot:m.547715 g.547715  ORF g.547715 m.547715 type:complete len:99 (-) comp22158_c1_seq2:175-471(-)
MAPSWSSGGLLFPRFALSTAFVDTWGYGARQPSRCILRYLERHSTTQCKTLPCHHTHTKIHPHPLTPTRKFTTHANHCTNDKPPTFLEPSGIVTIEHL